MLYTKKNVITYMIFYSVSNRQSDNKWVITYMIFYSMSNRQSDNKWVQ